MSRGLFGRIDDSKAAAAINKTNQQVDQNISDIAANKADITANKTNIAALQKAAQTCNPCDIIGKTKQGWKWQKQVQNGEIQVPTDWKLDESGRIVDASGEAIQKTTGAELDGKPVNIFAGQEGSGKDAKLTVTNGAGKVYFENGKLTQAARDDYSHLNDAGKKVFQDFAKAHGIQFDSKGNASWIDPNNKPDLSEAAQNYLQNQLSSAGAKRDSVAEPNMVSEDKTVQEVLTDHDGAIADNKQKIDDTARYVDQVADQAADNTNDIAQNKSDIAENKQDIGGLKEAARQGAGVLMGHEKAINRNAAGIAQNKSDIAENKQDIGGLKEAARQGAGVLMGHEKAINRNAAGIAQNKSDIGHLRQDTENGFAVTQNILGNHREQIDTNTTNIGNNRNAIIANSGTIAANKILAEKQAQQAEQNANNYTDGRLGNLGYAPKRDANGNIMLDANGKAIPADPAQPKEKASSSAAAQPRETASPYMVLTKKDDGNDGNIPETAGGTPPAAPEATVKDYVDIQRAEAMQQVNQNIAAASRNTLNTANAYADGASARALQSANAYTDSRYNRLDGKLKKLRARADAGTAAAVAIGSLSFDTSNANSLAGGLSVAKNKVAGAVGYQHKFNANWSARGTISVSDSYVTGGASVGYSW